MLRQRQKAYSKENATCEWNDGGKIDNKKIIKTQQISFISQIFLLNNDRKK